MRWTTLCPSRCETEGQCGKQETWTWHTCGRNLQQTRRLGSRRGLKCVPVLLPTTTEVPTEQSASQGSAPNAGSMQSGAVAHDCEGSREGVSSLVCVIQARGQDEEVPGMQPLFAWLEHSPDHVPAEGQLRMQSPLTLNLWKHRSRLRWHQGVLQYQWDFGPWQSWLLLVPTQLKEEMLRHFHDSATGGHLGVIKTVARLRQRCYWYGMVRDVQAYIATCAECTRNKRVRVNPRAPLQCFQAGNPGNGPFLESSRGNRYVLMMVDQFTHWLKRSVYRMWRRWLVFFSRAILFGSVCLLSSILTRAGILMGISSRHSVMCWTVWRPGPHPIGQVRTGRLSDTTNKCWISCSVSCKVSNDVGTSICQYLGWLCGLQLIGVRDSRRTCYS